MANRANSGRHHRGKSTAETAEALILPVLEELGLMLWDVRFEKEGSVWYLRYLIDREGGVTIKDLEAVSRAIDKILDDADPIPQAYVLEVSSPGAERAFTRDRHFDAYMGEPVQVRLIRPVEGVRDFVGKLAAVDGDQVTILLGDGEDEVEMTFAKKESAWIRLYVDFETGGYEE